MKARLDQREIPVEHIPYKNLLEEHVLGFYIDLLEQSAGMQKRKSLKASRDKRAELYKTYYSESDKILQGPPFLDPLPPELAALCASLAEQEAACKRYTATIESTLNSPISVNERLAFLKECIEPDENLMHVACAQQWLNVVIFLVEEVKDDINAIDAHGLAPLLLAVRNGHVNVARYLLQQPTIQVETQTQGGVTALHWCCATGHIELVKLLLEKKTLDLNAAITPGYWPMFNDCAATPYTIALTNRQMKIATLLLADERLHATAENELLLTLATCYGDNSMQRAHVRKLLAHQADPTAFIHLKEFKLQRDALGMAEFFQLEHIVPILRDLQPDKRIKGFGG